MKRIGVLLAANKSSGGTLQYSLAMLEALKLLNDYKITLYVSKKNTSYDNCKFLIQRLNLGKGKWILHALFFILKIKIKEPFLEEDFIVAPVSSPILLITKKDFLFTLHDLQEYYFPSNFSRLQIWWRRFINKALTEKAKIIICESNYVKNDIIKYFNINPNKIRVIICPPYLGLKTNIETESSRFKLPKKYLLYPASFWPHKNHLRLIETFKMIADHRHDLYLVLTGNKYSTYKILNDKVKELRLESKVIFLGFVDEDELAVIYKNALMLVMPTLFESVSIPIYEAFNYGVPVCCSNILALPEQVRDAGLLFDPMSTSSMYSSIIMLLDNEKIRNQLVINGYEILNRLRTDNYSNTFGLLLDSLTNSCINNS